MDGFLCMLLVAVGGGFFSGSLLAQTSTDRSEAARQSEIIQRQAQEQILRDQEAARGAERPPSGQDPKQFLPKVDGSAIGRVCQDIKTVSIRGATGLSPTVREHVTREFAGSCVGVTEIEQILARITADYVRRGFITTRAYLPQQDLSLGNLEILVVEGVIGQIMINDAGLRSIQPFNAFPARAGDLLNLRDLEQGVDQINRLSSNSAQLDIKPGDQAGVSTVIVNNTPGRPVHASLSLDNQGSESTGKNQVGLSFMTDRLLGLNELLVLTHRESAPNDRARRSSVSDSFSVVIPWGYSTFSATKSRSTYVTAFNAPSGIELKAEGVSTSDALKLDHVIYRDQDTRVSLSGALTAKDSKNYLEGEYLEVSSRRLNVLDLGASISTVFLGGVLTLDGGFAKGLSLGGSLIDPPNLPDYAPRAQFRKYVYGAGYTRPFSVFGTVVTLSSQLSGQYTRQTLYGSEQFSIGGIYSVRGFSRNSLSANSGYYLRNELSVRPVVNIGSQAIPARFYAAIDTGEVSGSQFGTPEARLTGMALGMSVAWKAVSLDLSHARPLSSPSFLSREAPQTWVRMNFSI